MPVSNRDVRLVQVDYPQIYFACHTRHIRRASTPERLSAADSTLLAHLDEQRAVRATTLARHLGVANSTLSAAITRLAKQGYVIQSREAADRRAIELRLSQKGAAAMQAGSVLDTPRGRKMLEQLTPSQRTRALAGLALLARAARVSGEKRS